MNKCITFVITALLLITVPVLSGPLANSRVSAEADWVVHLDLNKLVNTQLGKLVRGELNNLGLNEKLTNFMQIFGFNPLDDLKNVTLYGTGPDDKKAVAVVDGNFDQSKLLAVVGMNPTHEEFGYSDVTMHKWTQEENKNGQTTSQTMYGCIYKARTVILGKGLDSVQKAVDVLDGKSANASALIKSPALDMKDAFVQVTAKNVSKIAAEQGQAALLRQVETFNFSVGEVGQKLFVSAMLSAADEQSAQALSKMAEGMLAFAAMSAQEQPKLAELTKNVKITCEGNAVGLRYDADSNMIFSFLKEQWQKDQNKQQTPAQ